jgi:hypothetical protein
MIKSIIAKIHQNISLMNPFKKIIYKKEKSSRSRLKISA